jgi:hypothetical protein
MELLHGVLMNLSYMAELYYATESHLRISVLKPWAIWGNRWSYHAYVQQQKNMCKQVATISSYFRGKLYRLKMKSAEEQLYWPSPEHVQMDTISKFVISEVAETGCVPKW